MSKKCDSFAKQVEQVVALFETLVKQEWISRRDLKRMRDEEGVVFAITSLMLFKGSVRLLLDPSGYDVPGAEGVMDLYLLPPYDPVATLYLENGVWFIHSPFLINSKAEAGHNHWNRLPLTADTVHDVLEEIANHAIPSV